MKDNSFGNFISSFYNAISFIADRCTSLYIGDDRYVGRIDGDNICAVNLRLLYRIAMSEGFTEALGYFMSDQMISDAYDPEDPCIKLMDASSVIKAA